MKNLTFPPIPDARMQQLKAPCSSIGQIIGNLRINYLMDLFTIISAHNMIIMNVIIALRQMAMLMAQFVPE